MERTPGKPGRPRQLSLELIVQAVLDDGIATFSMPSVAARLGVAHSGLYRYVRDRDELGVNALEHAALSVEWPEPDLPWRELMREIAKTVWAICDRYPGYHLVALSPPAWPQRVIDQVSPYIASLHEQGFTLEDASVAVDFAGRLALTSSSSNRVQRADLPGTDLLITPHDWHDRTLDIVLDGLQTRLAR